MFEFFRSAVQIVAPIYVISTMLNVGLTQKLSDIIERLNNYSFVLKMLLANFVVAPLLMIVALYFAPLPKHSVVTTRSRQKQSEAS